MPGLAQKCRSHNFIYAAALVASRIEAGTVPTGARFGLACGDGGASLLECCLILRPSSSSQGGSQPARSSLQPQTRPRSHPKHGFKAKPARFMCSVKLTHLMAGSITTNASIRGKILNWRFYCSGACVIPAVQHDNCHVCPTVPTSGLYLRLSPNLCFQPAAETHEEQSGKHHGAATHPICG